MDTKAIVFKVSGYIFAGLLGGAIGWSLNTGAGNSLGAHKALPKSSFPQTDFETGFDRAALVKNVYYGDMEAALQLAYYYGNEGIGEAEYYWLSKAVGLGFKGISEEALKACERGNYLQYLGQDKK